MITLRVHGAMVLASSGADEDGVERAEDGTPKAFRIWRAGANVTDHGTHVFSEESARALMAEQSARGNLYSIDVDHMSLNKESPPESRKAVGWHRLDVRNGELWAVDVEWTDTVRAGLTKQPPEWRYFSPAYDVAKKSGEITSYLNTALTNNPATWSVTALASRNASTERTMNEEEMRSALAAWAGDDDDKKAAAAKQLSSMFPDKSGDDDKKAADSASGEPDGDEPKGDEKKEASVAATASARDAAALLATIGEQDRRIKELEAASESSKRTQILASRPDLSKAQREYLEKQPVAKLQELLSLIPVSTEIKAAATPTRGSEQGAVRASKLPPSESEALKRRMGLVNDDVAPRREGSGVVFPAMTPDQAKRVEARRAAEGGAK